MIADFRRFIRRPLTRRETRLIEHLERQRHACRRIRAYVHDPYGHLTRVICEYISWHQQRLSLKDCIMVTPRKLNPLHPVAGIIPRCNRGTARSAEKFYGRTTCIGQVVLFGADMYCPSVPQYRSYLDRLIQYFLPMLCGPDTIFIVTGNANHRHTRFRTLWRQWNARIGEAAVFTTLVPELLQAPCRPVVRKPAAQWPAKAPVIYLEIKTPPPLIIIPIPARANVA